MMSVSLPVYRPQEYCSLHQDNNHCGQALMLC